MLRVKSSALFVSLLCSLTMLGCVPEPTSRDNETSNKMDELPPVGEDAPVGYTEDICLNKPANFRACGGDGSPQSPFYVLFCENGSPKVAQACLPSQICVSPGEGQAQCVGGEEPVGLGNCSISCDGRPEGYRECVGNGVCACRSGVPTQEETCQAGTSCQNTNLGEASCINNQSNPVNYGPCSDLDCQGKGDGFRQCVGTQVCACYAGQPLAEEQCSGGQYCSNDGWGQASCRGNNTTYNPCGSLNCNGKNDGYRECLGNQVCTCYGNNPQALETCNQPGYCASTYWGEAYCENNNQGSGSCNNLNCNYYYDGEQVCMGDQICACYGNSVYLLDQCYGGCVEWSDGTASCE